MAAEAPEDLALQPPPVIYAPGPQYQSVARSYQGIPTVERTPEGRLWAAWYSGGPGEGPGNYVPLVTSADEGETWTEPVLVVAPPAPCRAADPCLWLDPRGRLWLFCMQSEGWFDGRAGVWALVTTQPEAAAPIFSAPRRLCHGVMLNKPLVLSSGEWVLPAALWNREPFRPELDAERFSNLIVSNDEGATWTRRGGADVPDRSFDEHMILERHGGSLWMLVRTHPGIGEAISRDGGHTWEGARPDALPGPCSRFHLRRLQSGRVLLISHDMQLAEVNGVRQRSHLTAWVSDDEGATWTGGLLLDERQNVSYPDATQAPEGRIYVIYDHERGDSQNLPHPDRAILMAVFTEEDILAGACVSQDCRLRVLVNRATASQEESKI